MFLYFYMNFLKNKHLVPVLHMYRHFSFYNFFWAKFLKCTIIERYQILPVFMFTVIYKHCILLTMLTPKLEITIIKIKKNKL